jgi:hypothetical protein
VDGDDVGDAIVDTGGAYEVILRNHFGLAVVDTVQVLGFYGPEHVAVTEPFPYSAGGVSATAEFALVGLSACDCNGLGFRFFRKTQTVLELDFTTMLAAHRSSAPADGATIVFAVPPPGLDTFDSAFLEVDVRAEGGARRLLALLDTGSNATVLRRGIFSDPSGAVRKDVVIEREEWGTVAVAATLFDTSGLPDIILGTDVMRAWSDRWAFTFAEQGGTVTAYPRYDAGATTE